MTLFSFSVAEIAQSEVDDIEQIQACLSMFSSVNPVLQ